MATDGVFMLKTKTGETVVLSGDYRVVGRQILHPDEDWKARKRNASLDVSEVEIDLRTEDDTEFELVLSEVDLFFKLYDDLRDEATTQIPVELGERINLSGDESDFPVYDVSVGNYRSDDYLTVTLWIVTEVEPQVR